MKALLTLLVLTLAFNSFCQDTTKVEQYCEVIVTERTLSNKVAIDINYGEARSVWKDYRLRDEQGKVQKFNSTIDAINYLGKSGWKLVNAFPMSNTRNAPMEYHYIFRKEFPKSETESKEMP